MKNNIITALLLSIMSVNCAFAKQTVYAPDNENPMFQFEFYGKGEITEENQTSTEDFTQEEISALSQAGILWSEIINNTAENPALISVRKFEENNAGAFSEYYEFFEGDTLSDYKITALMAAINNKTITGTKLADSFIYIGPELIDNAGWDTSTEKTALYKGNNANLYIVMEHELGHALGIASGSTLYGYSSGYYLSHFSNPEYSSDVIDTERSDKLTIFDKYLRVYDSSQDKVVTSERGMIINLDKDKSASDFGSNSSHVFDVSKNSPYFAGPETMKVLSGFTDKDFSGKTEDEIIKACEDEIASAGGLANYTSFYKRTGVTSDYIRANGLPIHTSDASLYYYSLYGSYFPDLSHVELRNSLMSHQNYRNWATFMEAELALLKDIGYNINLDDYFGKSFYLDNKTADITENIDLSKDYAVGVHVYGENNNITQDSDIKTSGMASFGVRIDGVDDKYTLDGGKITTTGDNSIALGVTYGSGHEINLNSNSEIKVSGNNSNAISIDFGKNILGDNVAVKGSYINTLMGVNQDLNELNAPLVDNLNINGK